MKISFNRFFTFLALSFFIFSCTEEAVEAPKEAITLGTIEQFLGTEINTPEDFPKQRVLTEQEIEKILTYVDAALQNAENSELEFRRRNFLNYRLFVLAAIRTGVVNDIINAEVTVFAPNNDAFAAIGISNSAQLAGIPTDALRAILEYHVVPSGRFFAADLENKFYPTTAGPAVEVGVDASGVTVNDVNVVDADVFFAFLFNGVAHGIDEVLTAPDQTIVEIAIAANTNPGEFTQLEAAVVRADLAGTLSGEGPFTVFAPTDDAFNALFDALDTDVNSIDIDLLKDVLLYHVIPARVFSTDLANGTANTLNGSVGIDVDNLQIIDSTTEPANLIPGLLNIQGSNGVIHAIDKVLLP
ncbi:MAG: fasciclin domain-containing protein [Mameliella sp.]|nr:fasciclin domain-containing protein [Phaeodactylibacter sp.]